MEDNPHRFLNVMVKGTYVAAHRHLDVLPHRQRGEQRALLEQDTPAALDPAPLYWPAVAAIIGCYAVLTHLVKTWFVKRWGM